MENIALSTIIVLFSNLLFSQNIIEPSICFAGSNGTNPAVVTHPEARCVLIAEHWSNIETSSGGFDFTSINGNIAIVTNANLKYLLAILGGTLATPDWVIDSIGAIILRPRFKVKTGGYLCGGIVLYYKS